MSAEAQVKELEQKVSDQAAASQSNSAPPEAGEPADVQQVNWRQFRQQREKERKEKEESDRRAREERERAAQKEAEVAALKAALESVVKPRSEESEPTEKTQEQLIDEKVERALEKERQKNAQEAQKREAAELPNRLAQTFSDFNQVVTDENVDYLKFHNPEIWAGYKNALENYETYAGLYKAIKKHVPVADAKKESAKIEKNLSKPQSPSQAGMAVGSDQAPHRLDDQKKQANWLRMRKAMKNL